MFRKLRTLPFALALAAVSIFATSCGSSSSTKFRVINAIPDATQSPDVLIDGKVVVTAAQFDTPPSGYLGVSSGTRHVQLFPTGQTTGAYFDGNISFSGGNIYTMVATGDVFNNTVIAPLFTDNNTAPTTGNASIRVIHASPSGPTPVDVYVVAQGGVPTGTPSLSSINYASASGYLSVPAGTYDLLVTPAGLTAVDIRYTISPASGQIRTFVLVDVANGGGMSGTPLVLTDLN